MFWLMSTRRSLAQCCLHIGCNAFGPCAESAIYAHMVADPLRSVHAALNQGGAVFNDSYSATQLWVFPKAWFVTPYEFGLHYYLLFAAMVWTLAAWRREYFVLLVWLVIVLVWLQVGGNPFAENYRIKSHLSRYCLTVAVPAVVMIAGMLEWLWRVGFKRIAATAASVAILAGVVLTNFNSLSGEGVRATKLGLDYLVAQQGLPAYLDRKSYDLAYWYWDGVVDKSQFYPIQRHDFSTGHTDLVPQSEIHGWVLINRVFDDYAFRRYGIRLRIGGTGYVTVCGGNVD
ncbi:MAG: hypothetical protein IPO82_05885 [Betaproteobacteria bacterium]|nr:hypothetical protein [Betaproteobacteria bacterium]